MNRQEILDFFYSKYKNKEKTEQKIPKKIHQIWLGDIPDRVRLLSERIKELHIDWEYKLWTYDDVYNFKLDNERLFSTLKNRGSQSDVFRYEILNRYGGIYLDTDFFILKKFDELINLEFFSGNGSDTAEIYNGLFGCIPDHPILKKVINELSNLDSNSVNSINDVMYKTGPYLFADKSFEYLLSNLDSNSVILPREYFYSLPGTLRYELRAKNYDEYFIRQNITDKSICVHLWDNTWQ